MTTGAHGLVLRVGLIVLLLLWSGWGWAYAQSGPPTSLTRTTQIGADTGGSAKTGPTSKYTLEADVSLRSIPVNVRFSGARIVMFGSVSRVGPPLSDAGPLDIVAVVQGARTKLTVRRKSRVWGIWLNTRSVEFEQAPRFYAVVSTRPIEGIAPTAVLADNGIGFDQVSISTALGEAAGLRPAFMRTFRDAAIQLGIAQKHYVREDGGISFVGSSLFRGQIDLPASIPVGELDVTVFVFRGGQMQARHESRVTLARVGIESVIYDFAQTQGVAYGLATVALAVGVGLMSSFIVGLEATVRGRGVWGRGVAVRGQVMTQSVFVLLGYFDGGCPVYCGRRCSIRLRKASPPYRGKRLLVDALADSLLLLGRRPLQHGVVLEVVLPFGQRAALKQPHCQVWPHGLQIILADASNATEQRFGFQPEEPSNALVADCRAVAGSAVLDFAEFKNGMMPAEASFRLIRFGLHNADKVPFSFRGLPFVCAAQRQDRRLQSLEVIAISHGIPRSAIGCADIFVSESYSIFSIILPLSPEFVSDHPRRSSGPHSKLSSARRRPEDNEVISEGTGFSFLATGEILTAAHTLAGGWPIKPGEIDEADRKIVVRFVNQGIQAVYKPAISPIVLQFNSAQIAPITLDIGIAVPVTPFSAPIEFLPAQTTPLAIGDDVMLAGYSDEVAFPFDADRKMSHAVVGMDEFKSQFKTGIKRLIAGPMIKRGMVGNVTHGSAAFDGQPVAACTWFYVDNSMHSGASGGPIVDDNGEARGIIIRRSTTSVTKIDGASELVPSGSTLGIGLDILRAAVPHQP